MMNESTNCFQTHELKNENHPFFSFTHSAWAAVTIGHVFARLHINECKACRTVNLSRTYFFDKLALIRPMSSFNDSERSGFLGSTSIKLFELIQQSPAWVISDGFRPLSVHSVWPEQTRRYMSQSRRFFSMPFAKHVPVGSQIKYLGNACVTCAEVFPITQMPSPAYMDLLINDHEQALVPQPIFCSLLLN